MTNEQPSYYAILPAVVRYDSSLNSSQKLLFSEITALTNKTGVCWASNNYFANLYNVDPSTVSKWVSALESKGYIKINYIKEGKQIKQRRIELIQEVLKLKQEGIENIQGGIEKTPKRIIKANNTNNIKKEYSDSIRGTRVIMSEKEFDKYFNS